MQAKAVRDQTPNTGDNIHETKIQHSISLHMIPITPARSSILTFSALSPYKVDQLYIVFRLYIAYGALTLVVLLFLGFSLCIVFGYARCIFFGSWICRVLCCVGQAKSKLKRRNRNE